MNIDYQFTHFDTVKQDGTLGKFHTFQKELKYFAGKGEIEILVRKKRAKRSNEQNRLYRAYVRLLAEHTGYTEEEMHSVIGLKFRKVYKVDEQTGEVLYYIRSTTQMNKMEMADHITEIQQWCETTFHFRLPNPNETWEIRLL